MHTSKSRMKDITGNRYGNLIVEKLQERVIRLSDNKPIYYWLCKCDCGNTKISSTNNLTSGNTRSCGCLLLDYQQNTPRKIPKDLIKMYSNLYNAINRCNNPKSTYYDYYGGRGITITDRWMGGEQGFNNFLEDMGKCPKGLSLDRIDVNKGYYKENCRWASDSEQSFNTRKYKNNTSGRTGVLWNKSRNNWIAEISKEGKRNRLGSFGTFEEAVLAREKAEIEYYGHNKN